MSKVYKVGDVFYSKELNCYVKAVASDSECCDGDKCALHRYDCSNIDDCSGFRFIKLDKLHDYSEAHLMLKGERMANSIMGFNSELPPFTVKPRTLLDLCRENNTILSELPFVTAKSNQFIVSLLENGILQPSAKPKIHSTIESAEMEAERLCKLHESEFVVLKVTASFKPQQPKKEVFA